jgi:hypothetical protein
MKADNPREHDAEPKRWLCDRRCLEGADVAVPVYFNVAMRINIKRTVLAAEGPIGKGEETVDPR